MKKYHLQFSVLVGALIISIFTISFLWKQNTRPLYSQLESSINKIDSNFSKILHVHVDQRHTFVFYSTNHEELGVVTLHKTLTGFKLESYVSKTPLVTEKDISWQGTSKPDEGIYLLYGRVGNLETAQINIVSEGNQSAHLIRNGSLAIWYFISPEAIQTPVTIRTFNKDGKKLYETGDTAYWNDHSKARLK